MSAATPEQLRAEMLQRWERATTGWGRRAEAVREFGMPVSAWMLEHLDLQPGETVLELGAGPGDTGFLAAELVRPAGRLLCSDASEAMLGLARERAAAQGIDNVEFRRLEVEWIDLPAASVDAVLCRWVVMLVIDPAAALKEIRRVLRPGGRGALAVWDQPERNPWATIPTQALIRLGHASPPDPGQPGMFALAAPGRLEEMLLDAGFGRVVVEAVELDRELPGVADYIAEALELSVPLAEAFDGLSEAERAEVRAEIERLARPFLAADGSLRLPAQSLVALAQA